MKIKNVLAITALVGLGVSAQATTITFLENGQNTVLGNTATFTEGGASLTAYGFASANTATALYAKNLGADEIGLGINSDPSSDHEIWGTTFIQLLSSTSGGFDVTGLNLGSVTPPDIAKIYFSTTKGVLGTLIGTLTADGSFAVAGAYQNGYIGVAAGGGNILLGAVTGTQVPDGGTTVAMLGLGLTAVGLLRRKLAA